MSKASTLIVGIGSPHGDDQAGWRIAEALARRHDLAAHIRLARSPADLLGWLSGVERLVVCDACHGAGPVGTVHSWKWPADQLELVQGSGTHDLDVGTTLALAERIGCLPSQATIWCVESLSAGCLQSMSALVADQIPLAARRVAEELKETTPSDAATPAPIGG